LKFGSSTTGARASRGARARHLLSASNTCRVYDPIANDRAIRIMQASAQKAASRSGKLMRPLDVRLVARLLDSVVGTEMRAPKLCRV
jgi:hypothetical protein